MSKPDRFYDGASPSRDHVAIVLGIAATILVGQLVRLGRFPDPLAGVLFSAITDSSVLATVIPVLMVQRWAYRKLPFGAAILATGTVMAAAVCLVVAVTMGIEAIDPAFAAPYAANRVVQANYYLIILLGWSVTAAWLRTRQASTDRLVRTLQAERAATEADMSRLRMQLDTHFLFNALNTIAVEIQDNPRDALLLVRELSHYLRYSVETADRKLVPISTEVAALRSFMRVQTLRFGSQLTFQVDQNGSTRGKLIPAFLVQPLVENAAKHSIPGDDGTMRITLRVHMVEDSVQILVTNPGNLLWTSQRTGTGTGLVALSRRLDLHYPGRHHFALVQEGELVRAELTLDGPAC